MRSSYLQSLSFYGIFTVFFFKKKNICELWVWLLFSACCFIELIFVIILIVHQGDVKRKDQAQGTTNF